MRLILPILTIISFVTAFLRDIIFARELGAGLESDALWLALMLPAIFEQIIGGPLRDALIARLGQQHSGAIMRAIFVLVPTVLVSVFVVGPLWAAQNTLSGLLTPGWSPQAQFFSIHVLAIGLLMIPGHTVFYAQSAIAASGGRFALAHSRSIWLNLAAIVAILAYPGSPTAIIWGMILGTVLHAVTMEILNILSKPRIAISAASEQKRAEKGIMLLAAFAVCAISQQLCVLLERNLASQISAGSITHLSLAYRLSTLVVSIGVASLIVPIYAQLESLGLSDRRVFWQTLSRQLKWVFLLILPSTAALLATSQEIVQTLFVQGAFQNEDAIATSSAIQGYAIGLPFICLTLILVRALFARRKIALVVCSALLMFVVYATLSLGFGYGQNVGSLALLFSVAQIVFGLCLSAIVFREMTWPVISEGVNWVFVAVILAASCLVFLILDLWPYRSVFGLSIGVGLSFSLFIGATVKWMQK